MKPVAKVGIVVGGYVVAFLVAVAVLTVYIAATASPDRETYAAMYNFGDSLLFLWTFAVAATVPTGLALYFLRSSPLFWRTLSVWAVIIASTALMALAAILLGRRAAMESGLVVAAMWGTLRIFFAPVFGSAFFVAGLFAPSRPARVALFGATGAEAAAFAYFAFPWFLQAFARVP